MLINGEKWACESCIKGHRVSGCQHADRELHHINPKGRPVKQCEHCRNARKSKAHHAKCECGDKRDGHCGCQHNAPSRCTCSSKKNDHMKLDLAKAGGIVKKPRLTAANSDNGLSAYKAPHRLNNAAHLGGSYKIPKSHTLHSHSNSTHSNISSAPHSLYQHELARRSADNLPYSSTGDAELGGFYPTIHRSVENLSMPDNGPFNMQHLLYNNSHLDDGMHSSVHGSPVEPLSCGGQVPLSQWPGMDLTGPLSDYGIEPSLAGSPVHYGTPEPDWPLSATPYGPTWSASDLPLESAQLHNDFKPVSHSGESNPHSVPGLTSSPGMGSEAGEPTSFGELDALTSTSLPLEQTYEAFKPANRFSSGMLPEMARPPTSSPDMSSNRRSLDINLIKRPDGEMNYFLENQMKEIPRTEPVSYSNCGSPVVGSLHAMTSQPPYSPVPYEAQGAMLGSNDYAESPVGSLPYGYPNQSNQLGVPLDQLREESHLGYPASSWA